MKVAYASDFHFEFYTTTKMKNIIEGWVFEPDTEVIIIAGDLNMGADNVIYTLEFIISTHDIPVVYVPGNHEYYNSSFKDENLIFMSNNPLDRDFHILLRNYVQICDVTFCGCMGNIDGSWESINIVNHGALNDFHMIKDFYDHDIYGGGERIFMEKSLRDTLNPIGITHTMPSPLCISDKYKGNYLSPCFANNWESLMLNYYPKYWICGHSHESTDVVIGRTRVLSNPYGYPDENMGWEWRYIDV